MLTQIALLYGASWLLALAAAGVCEWGQLTARGGSRAAETRGGWLRRAVFGWVALPFVAPGLIALAVARARRGAA